MSNPGLLESVCRILWKRKHVYALELLDRDRARVSTDFRKGCEDAGEEKCGVC